MRESQKLETWCQNCPHVPRCSTLRVRLFDSADLAVPADYCSDEPNVLGEVKDAELSSLYCGPLLLACSIM